MTALAVLLAGAAAILAMPLDGNRSLAVLRPGDPVNPTRRTKVLVALGALAVLLAFAQGTWLALGLIVLATSLGVLRLMRSARARRVADSREELVLEVCELLVGELRAGQPPVTALGSCTEIWPEFAPVPTAARLGADVPNAIRRVGDLPGAHGLQGLAAAWQVSQGSGAGLAVALSHVAVSARESQSTRRLVAAELASAQATARLVAGLPLLTLLLGSGIGGDPWQFLLTTPIGLACLATGLTLALAGLAWIDRIAAAVLR